MANKNDPFVREIANTMIECIKAGTAPWQKTWEKSNCKTASAAGARCWK